MKRVAVRPRRVVEVRGEVVERVRRGDQLQPRRFPRRLNPNACVSAFVAAFLSRECPSAASRGRARRPGARSPPATAPRAAPAGPNTSGGVRREQVKSKQSPAIVVVVGLRAGRLRRARRRARRRASAPAREGSRRVLATSASARLTPGAAAAGLDGARYERARDEPARRSVARHPGPPPRRQPRPAVA